MKTNKKEHIEAKIARSKARIEARNAHKAEARLLQGVPMFVSEEEKEAREKAEKKPITPKKWKEIQVCKLVEAQAKTPKDVKPKDFYSEELKSRRKAKREHLKTIVDKRKESFKLQSTSYSKQNEKQSIAQAKFNMMILAMKEKQKLSKKQSKEDKAKHKASLAASKTHVKKDNKASLAA